MNRALKYLAAAMCLIGGPWGAVRIALFLYHQWGCTGLVVFLTFVPPIVIVPVWEWVATGNWITFGLIYGLVIGGMALTAICNRIWGE